jgi:hypothetical protein
VKSAILGFIAAAVLPGIAAAQSFSPQPQLYLTSVDAADARAVWLQPAGLSRRQEASIGIFAGGERSGAGGLTQYGAVLSSGPIGLGWQHDRRSSSVKNDMFTVALTGGNQRAGVGLSRSFYKGTGTKDGGFTFGARYAPRPSIETSLVLRDVGSPVILGDTLRATLLPAVAWNTLGGRARFSAEWEVVTGEWGTSAVRTGVSVGVFGGFILSARGEFSGGLEGRSLAIALTWGALRGRATAFATDIRGASDPFGIYAASVRPLQTQRRRPTRPF